MNLHWIRERVDHMLVGSATFDEVKRGWGDDEDLAMVN